VISLPMAPALARRLPPSPWAAKPQSSALVWVFASGVPTSTAPLRSLTLAAVSKHFAPSSYRAQASATIGPHLTPPRDGRGLNLAD
jgi:hypothetical protein